MYLSTVSDWLAYIGKLHPKEMDLGLDRVKKVAERLGVLKPECPVIIVGGTNGKGSTVFGLESIYHAAHYQTGVFSSPFLFVYNEEIRINGIPISDQRLCEAFAKVEAARNEITLTFFEFGTLAALVLFQQQPLDIWILEVGLGGRLDAVNIIDADLAVITSIGIDHVEWLGDTREKIGKEKSGIFRSHHPVVCGDEQPPATIVDAAKNLQSPFYQRGKDFAYQQTNSTWSFTNNDLHYENLPKNNLLMQNMAVVLQTIHLLQPGLPVTREAIDQGLKNINLPGRIQIIPGKITEIFDVSHNPAAIIELAKKLDELSCTGKTRAVFSMLEDKDMESSIRIIKNKIDEWLIAPLQPKRAASTEKLKNSFQNESCMDNMAIFQSIEQAYQQALKVSQSGDRIIIFGSFYTVAEVMNYKNTRESACKID